MTENIHGAPQRNTRRYDLPGEFTIRYAEEKDVPLVLEFIRELAAYEHLEDEVVATEDSIRESLFAKRHAEVIVGESDGAPVAFALFFYNYSTFLGQANLYLEDLFVKEEYRDRGFGKAMLRRLAGIAVERGCKRLDWWCLDWNRPAADFYRSLGAIAMEDWTVFRLEGPALADMARDPRGASS